jgi:formylglycine-generating enzyme required for sulfatase activity
MGKPFISYRRDDTLDFTGRLYERLAHHFGPESIFMDVEKIGLGSDFRQVLRDAISASDAVLVIIGRQWLSIADARGRRRLDSPDDYVRFEVEEALARSIPVVPVVTHGMAVPRERDLPKSIAGLAFRTGVDVRSDQHFGPDAEQLIARLTPLLPPRFPLPAVPDRLTTLGFRGVNLNETPAIIPPLVRVSAGVFLMGSKGDEHSASDESPQHRVEVGAFQIGKYPVTVAEYALAVQAGAVREPPDGPTLTRRHAVTWRQQLQHVDHPVVCVSWEDANAYIAWLRKATSQSGWRLPNEAQWEKAARWDELREVSSIYPWGDTFDKHRCKKPSENPSEAGGRKDQIC